MPPARRTLVRRVTPSFPLDPTVPRRSMWYFKKKVVPWLYWEYMLKGWDFDGMLSAATTTEAPTQR